MARIHRSLQKRAEKIDIEKTANRAEDYIDGFKAYKKYLEGISGLVSPQRLKDLIKKIDSLEREVIRYENKIDTLEMRRGVAAAQLEQYLELNLKAAKGYLDPEEYKDLAG